MVLHDERAKTQVPTETVFEGLVGVLLHVFFGEVIEPRWGPDPVLVRITLNQVISCSSWNRLRVLSASPFGMPRAVAVAY